jgi:hypothetical protein
VLERDPFSPEKNADRHAKAVDDPIVSVGEKLKRKIRDSGDPARFPPRKTLGKSGLNRRVFRNH